MSPPTSQPLLIVPATAIFSDFVDDYIFDPDDPDDLPEPHLSTHIICPALYYILARYPAFRIYAPLYYIMGSLFFSELLAYLTTPCLDTYTELSYYSLNARTRNCFPLVRLLFPSRPAGFVSRDLLITNFPLIFGRPHPPFY